MEITARKKTEQALRQAEELFRKLATFAPVGIFHSDERGGCLFVNDMWCSIVGVKSVEAKGDLWTRFLHPTITAASSTSGAPRQHASRNLSPNFAS